MNDVDMTVQGNLLQHILARYFCYVKRKILHAATLFLCAAVAVTTWGSVSVKLFH